MDGCLARTITKIEANPLLVRGKSDFRIMRVAAYHPHYIKKGKTSHGKHH